MFKSKIYEKLIESQSKEIEYLRGLVKDLNNRLIALSNKTEDYAFLKQQEDYDDKPLDDAIEERIDSIPAVTPEEKEQKMKAPGQIMEIIGH